MPFRRQRLKLTVLAVIAMTAQLFAWATHTHAWHSTSLGVVSHCESRQSASDKQQSCPEQDTEKTCPYCWGHLVSGTALTPHELAAPEIPAVAAPTFVLAAALGPAPTITAYGPRGPPVPVEN